MTDIDQSYRKTGLLINGSTKLPNQKLIYIYIYIKNTNDMIDIHLSLLTFLVGLTSDSLLFQFTPLTAKPKGIKYKGKDLKKGVLDTFLITLQQ